MDEDLALLPWRTGTRNHRAIYAQRGLRPDPGRDTFIGALDTPHLAAEAVAAHNRHLPDLATGWPGS